MLKWNISDLVNQLKNIQTKRIDSFEHGLVHFMEWENDALVRCFKKAGIRFKSDMEVSLETDKADGNQANAIQGDGARIVLDAEQKVISDSSVIKDPAISEAAEQSAEEPDKPH